LGRGIVGPDAIGLQGVPAVAAQYQISGMKNQSLTGHPGDFRFRRRGKIKLASQISQW